MPTRINLDDYRPYLDQQLKLAEAYRDTMWKLIEAYGSRTEGIVKDCANCAIAILGAAVTLITVAPSFIKTPFLFVLGLLILSGLIMVSFSARVQLSSFMTDAYGSIETRTGKILSFYGQVIINPNEETYGAFNSVVTDDYQAPRPSWLINHVNSIIAILFLLGFAITGISLVFKIQI